MALTPNGIRSPNDSDGYALVQDLGLLASTADAAITKRGNMYLGTAAQRTAFTTAVEGQHWQDTNGTKGEYVRQAGAWVLWLEPVTTQLTTLWSGTGVYLDDTQTITFSKPLTSCRTGLVMAWSAYAIGTGEQDSDWNYVHIPKGHLLVPGTGTRMTLAKGNTPTTDSRKYVYVTNTNVTGAAQNSTGENRNHVLRRIFEY